MTTIIEKLCIDCGGTKASYAAFSQENKLLEEGIIEKSCTILNNFENFISIVEELKSKYNPREVLVGVSGWIAFPDKEEILEKLGVQIVSDVNLATMALLRDGQRLGVVLGTGSVFFTKERVYGGFGHALGDEGSGYYFGKLALKKFLEEVEMDSTSNLRTKIEQYFGKSGRQVLSIALEDEKSNFSKLSKEFMDDQDFREVFDCFKEDFSTQVDFYMGLTNSKQIVISGSILKSTEFLSYVSNDSRFVINKTPLSHAILYKG